MFGLEVLSVQDSANYGTASVGGGQGGQINHNTSRLTNAWILALILSLCAIWFCNKTFDKKSKN